MTTKKQGATATATAAARADPPSLAKDDNQRAALDDDNQKSAGTGIAEAG
jgi:hypothetical protein